AMAVGSTHAALRNPCMAETFTIARKMNPEGMIFSNVGADVPVEKTLEAVELLEAQALQIHVNSPQELVMPEGNREFVTWLDNIASIVSRVSVPVIIKEVGFGMSKELMHDL
ncbi:type 2 isopentenyl-diphosphate Delta-isomerase, partial [Escherichia coli]|nr:type 2 isopentenyl-diphosphate Delta-isomerase [Escherichia coli]